MPVKACAIMSTFNESDIARESVLKLISQDVSVFIVDNGSTDGTVEQLSSLVGHGLIDIQVRRFFEGDREVYNWSGLLEAKETIARSLPHDWFLHVDADEIRYSPWPNVSLSGGIHEVDRQGFNLINFKVFNFQLMADTCVRDSFESEMPYYKPAAYFDTIQVKAWRRCEQFSLTRLGGHFLDRNDSNVFPTRFILKHYPVRSREQGVRKIFQERKARFSHEEKAKGWHVQYDHLQTETDLLSTIYADPAATEVFDHDVICSQLIREAHEVVSSASEAQEFAVSKGSLKNFFELWTVRLAERGLERGHILAILEWVAAFYQEVDHGRTPSIDPSLGALRVLIGIILSSLARASFLKGNPKLYEFLKSPKGMGWVSN